MPSWHNTPDGIMAAAVLSNPGQSPPAQCFDYTRDYPRPTLPSEDWILVRVHAFGLNRAELRSRAGLIPFPPEFCIFISEYHPDPPKILGEEFVGVVETPGSSTPFRKGEKVSGFMNGGGKAHDGSYAQYTLCHTRRLYHLPQTTSLSWPTLAAIPMSMWTAHGCINLSGGLLRRPNPAHSTVLIHGGTSSVGIWAITLAKHVGATVLATTRSKDKFSKLRAAGADHALLDSDLESEVTRLYPKGIDIIVELVGPNQLLRTLGLCARYGTVVIAGVLNLGWDAGPDFGPMRVPPTRNLSFYTMTNHGMGGPEDDDDLRREDVEKVLADVVELVEKGVGGFKEEVVLDRVFEGLEKVGEAHAYMEENKAVGKVVLSV